MRAAGGRVSVDFIDNGSGIPRESQSVIFEKFSRLADTRAAGGAGLGLAICREIVANLGGTIGYLPGQGGAAFRVTLPIGTGRRSLSAINGALTGICQIGRVSRGNHDGHDQQRRSRT